MIKEGNILKRGNNDKGIVISVNKGIAKVVMFDSLLVINVRCGDIHAPGKAPGNFFEELYGEGKIKNIEYYKNNCIEL